MIFITGILEKLKFLILENFGFFGKKWKKIEKMDCFHLLILIILPINNTLSSLLLLLLIPITITIMIPVLARQYSSRRGPSGHHIAVLSVKLRVRQAHRVL